MNVALTTQILPASEAAVAAAALSLREGGLVAFPTETVYGLGADATNPQAIARLYQAKGRPAFNPLIAHVSDLGAAERIANLNAQAIALAEAFWPGPLTLVLPKTGDCNVADLATARLDTIAIRVPALRSAGRWWRHRPICRVTFRRPRRRTYRATLPGGSI